MDLKRLLCCVILTLMLIPGGAAAEAPVRLHVIGETDLYEDQQYKLLVRDWTLEYIREHGPDDTAGLSEYLNSRNTDFGRYSPIRVERGLFPYSTGKHDAIRVHIGRAEGRNWWGLLYPEQSGLDGETIYYSAIVDWFLSLIGVE